MTAYQDLEQRFRRIAQLNGAMAVLHWDSATMMPAGGARTRADQLATLGVLTHERLIDPALGDLIAKADADALDEWQAANLNEMRRQWRHATAVPPDLVEARSLATSDAEMIWRTARAQNDFKALAGPWQKVLDLTRETAQAKAAAFDLSAYDALLDEYEAGGRAAMFEPLLDRLAAELPALIERILARQAGRGPALPLEGRFAIEAQRELSLAFMRALGFEFEHGRLDISHHPFTSVGVPDDVRITTRYDETNLTRGLMGVLHETGHALYERGLPAQWRHQPIGDTRSMTLHESQSLLIEMQVCRSDDFIAYAAPLVRRQFGGAGAAWSAENLAKIYRHVERGLIRVDADEATYPLHVILRYRLERQMIDGALRIADLPGAWNEGMRQLVGIVPPNDADGCMQDIHWPSGSYGYFPTYTLGAVAAAQLYAQARRDVPEIPTAIARGNFSPLLGWLRAKVHGQGSRYTYDELLRHATGRPLQLDDFLAHLQTRYLD
jgi:carboxypeptidase Taq